MTRPMFKGNQCNSQCISKHYVHRPQIELSRKPGKYVTVAALSYRDKDIFTTPEILHGLWIEPHTPYRLQVLCQPDPEDHKKNSPPNLKSCMKPTLHGFSSMAKKPQWSIFITSLPLLLSDGRQSEEVFIRKRIDDMVEEATNSSSANAGISSVLVKKDRKHGKQTI